MTQKRASQRLRQVIFGNEQKCWRTWSQKGGTMPNGYVIFTIAIHDQAGFEAYVQKTLPTLMQAGGRPIIVDDNPEVLEGQWHGTRTVVLEFDSLETARAWYSSAGYQAIVGERHKAAETNVVIVGGFVMPGS